MTFLPPIFFATGIPDAAAWELLVARTHIHRIIDARANEALRAIEARAESDRRSIGQLTRFDHIQKRTLA